MSELVPEAEKNIVKTKVGKAAAKIHTSASAETIAVRIKDAGALEKALVSKLESQRDFAGEYKSKFPHTGPQKKVEDSTVLNSNEWCLSFGFNARTVRRWLELLEPQKYVEKKNAILKRCWELAELWQAASYSSASNEWYTPARYLDAVRQLLGKIDLDPASNATANMVVRAETIFTQEQNGLEKKWFGRVFMNPPYGKTETGDSLAAEFCHKALSEYDQGNIVGCIILVNSLHSQAWQAPLYNHPICFVDHRIQFISGDGEKNKNPTFQNIFIYLGGETSRFADIFSKFGYVMQRIA